MDNTVYTGFEAIDKGFGGLRPGEVTLIGGRPSMGKTTLALQIALNLARSGKNVFFYTAECYPIDLELQLISFISDIDRRKIRAWDMTDDEWNLFKKTAREVKELPIRFVLTNTVQMINLRCDNDDKAADLVIFDYLQLAQFAYSETEGCARRLAYVDILKAFRKLARKHNVPVVVLSQLSRKLERRKDKHPRVSDLRIEKLTDDDYDQAFLIYREAYYDMDAPRDRAELIGVCPKRKLKETVEMRCDYKKGVFK